MTPIQQAMLKILADGRPHSKFELINCCNGGTRVNSVWMHISRMRKELNPKGEDILCVFNKRRRFYQHVRLLASANDGRK